ncbi:HAD family hydrolase [Candidatus Parabeggiatoa sp. HSG14]|uniref:YqeG family HAD IIIA-type phosphatase n=1 Tax=Candidatus Parabeggiatoa sp. HSG14 TaxID=3055593 RepID=UPI0025A81FB4|nr:HAD family hydrolase [Thiotrichales bacterium HSG14]
MVGKLKKVDYLAQSGILQFSVLSLDFMDTIYKDSIHCNFFSLPSFSPFPLILMELLKRIFFSFQMLHRYRHALAKIYHNNPHNVQLRQISPAILKQKGIAVLVLDFDGVLAAHGEPYPVEELHDWLNECISTFGSTQIFILSNKPLQNRITYFNQYYQGVRYIAEVKKKPYPDGLQKIMVLTGQSSETLMLVDDRLLTGGLAACIANVPMIYITRPYVLLSKRPLQELFFMMLRFVERRFIQLYSWLR